MMWNHHWARVVGSRIVDGACDAGADTLDATNGVFSRDPQMRMGVRGIIDEDWRLKRGNRIFYHCLLLIKFGHFRV
jgi:hypothetical protein